jgi:hypothetical protein
MANGSSSALGKILDRITGNMRFPHLFLVLLGLLAVDLVIPDPIPFLDEAALALLTLMVSRWPARREETTPKAPPEPTAPKDVTDRGATLD